MPILLINKKIRKKISRDRKLVARNWGQYNFALWRDCSNFALAKESIELMYKVSIDKNILAELPQVTFPGNIYVVDRMSMVNSAVRVLRKHDIVGFDTETRPTFKKGRMHKVALLQLSTPNECFLFRLNRIGMPTSLHDYLEDENCLKVGLSVHDDFNALRRLAPDLAPAGFVDVQKLAMQNHITDISLQKIYAILFGERISKGQQLSNWEADVLTDAQQRYASIDAWTCIRIYDYLTAGNFVPQQSPYFSIIDEEVK